MNTRLNVVLIFFLFISNITWGYFYFTAETKETPNNNNGVQIYTLEGSGDDWKATNYKIIVTPDKIQRGHAKLIYLGNPKDIEESNYYNVTFYEKNHKNEQTGVYSRTDSSTDASVSILENINHIGSITGPYSYDETLRTRDNYDHSTIKISWNDSNGESHIETFDLHIVDEIIINGDEQE